MRLIDADVAQRIADEELTVSDAGTVQFVLSHTPTADAVEVVWCGECEYFHNLTCKIRKGSWGEQLKVGFSDFCSDGKRRDSDG